MPSPYFFKANESEGRIFRVGLVHYREPNKRMDERIMMSTKVLKFSNILYITSQLFGLRYFLFVPLQYLSTIRMGFEARFGKIQFGALRIYKT